MHDHDKHHKELIKGFFQDQQGIFENSTQAIYAYLDDEHKVCNQKFTKLLGYKDSSEWAKVGGNFLEAFVAPKSQKLLANTYQKAMEMQKGATIKVTWKKKSGGTVNTTVILVPVVYKDHVLALHFISR